jgi:hypothetical protein
MREYCLPRNYQAPKPKDPFSEYNITDEYIYECINDIANKLKGFNFNNNTYEVYEDLVHNIVEKDHPKLNEFIKGYGIGVFGFLAQFRNEIKKLIIKET